MHKDHLLTELSALGELQVVVVTPDGATHENLVVFEVVGQKIVITTY